MRDMDAVYREHARYVYRYLMSKTHCHSEAEELVQETFLQAVQSVERFDGSCKITTWLCGIARNLWLQSLEKKKKAPAALPEEPADAAAGVAEQVESREAKLDLYRLLHRLPDPMREVMYLRLSGELSFREIGVILGRDEVWARVTFYRGKQKLGRESPG